MSLEAIWAACVAKGGHWEDNQGLCHGCGKVLDEEKLRLYEGPPKDGDAFLDDVAVRLMAAWFTDTEAVFDQEHLVTAARWAYAGAEELLHERDRRRAKRKAGG